MATNKKTPTQPTTFTRANCRGFANEVLEALAPLAEKYGIKFGAGSISFSEFSMKFPLELVTSDVDPTKVAGSREHTFVQMALLLGLKREDLGREFQIAGQTYKLSGYQAKARKMPILALCIDNGKTYKFSEERIKEIFAWQDAQKARTA